MFAGIAQLAEHSPEEWARDGTRAQGQSTAVRGGVAGFFSRKRPV